MSKNQVIVVNLVLLVWFSLDMFGVTIGQHVLVSKAWKEDGLFFLIYLLALLLFIFYERIGKSILTVYLSLWLVTQFASHEYFTIFGGGEGKSEYFSDTIKLFESTTRYIPDLYHLMLHVLIIIVLICTIRYKRKQS
ncbi:hypothetical protein ACS127_01405 [Amphibacillus sp. Q70]|uniref:hypothetical protein n=1 Tax=Amphibacillus sp. Q70 TaxID=3453416 RepID=UPI003F864974